MLLGEIVARDSERNSPSLSRSWGAEDRAGEEGSVGFGGGESLELASGRGEDGAGVDEDCGSTLSAGTDTVALIFLALCSSADSPSPENRCRSSLTSCPSNSWE